MEEREKKKISYIKIAIGVGIGFILAKLFFDYVWPLIF